MFYEIIGSTKAITLGRPMNPQTGYGGDVLSVYQLIAAFIAARFWFSARTLLGELF